MGEKEAVSRGLLITIPSVNVSVHKTLVYHYFTVDYCDSVQLSLLRLLEGKVCVSLYCNYNLYILILTIFCALFHRSGVSLFTVYTTLIHQINYNEFKIHSPLSGFCWNGDDRHLFEAFLSYPELSQPRGNLQFLQEHISRFTVPTTLPWLLCLYV